MNVNVWCIALVRLLTAFENEPTSSLTSRRPEVSRDSMSFFSLQQHNGFRKAYKGGTMMFTSRIRVRVMGDLVRISLPPNTSLRSTGFGGHVSHRGR